MPFIADTTRYIRYPAQNPLSNGAEFPVLTTTVPEQRSREVRI